MAPLPATDDDGKPATSDEDIVKEAFDRHQATQEHQGVQDEWSREDIKFANADSRNAWAWPKAIYDTRTSDDSNLPCLTLPVTRVHNDIIINSISKNGFGAKVRPVGGKASYKSAQVMQSLIDRVQKISRGSAQRRKVCEDVVDGGIGYLLVETAYVSNRSRDQDIYLRAAQDPTGVALDPWIRQVDGLDANFGFVSDRMPRKEFDRKYPKWKDKVGVTTFVADMGKWIDDKSIMVVKYYRKSQKPDTYVWYKKEDGSEVEMLASEIKKESGEEIYKALMDDIKEGRIEGGTRAVHDDQVEWFLIAGDTIIERGEWAGKYVPILRAVGRERIIDNTLDRKGHTRLMIDPNRMLNYNASMAVQSVALQTKTQWTAPARAIEGQEQWKTSNVDNFAVLTYNDLDDEAPEGSQKIDRPQRVEPPQPSPAYEQGMQTAERQMMMVSGQWQSETGQQSNNMIPESGKAIGERKEQGDTATYHFSEHMSDLDRATGIVLLDLFPKIYDTERVLRIEGDDGERSWIRIDPKQDEIVRELQQEKDDEEAAKLAFNPKLGEYECISDPGPSLATQRQEAWNAASLLVQANKEIAASCMDLMIKYGDFKGADELAERLKKEIKATKPYLFDDAAEPQLLALQEQNKKLVALNAELMTKLADERLKLRGRDEKRDIDALNAETNRMKVIIEALMEHVLTPEQKVKMEHELELQARDHVFTTIRDANAAIIEGQNQPPPASAG